MARLPKPWWREDRNAWFVTIRGERRNLGPDKAAAEREFHRLMALPPEDRTTPKPRAELAIAEVFEKFLDWCSQHRASRTYDWYCERIQSFVDHLATIAVSPASALRPFHVVEWMDQHSGWGSNYRRGAIIAIQRPFNWATKLGYIEASPIRNIEKPQAKRREHPRGRKYRPSELKRLRDEWLKLVASGKIGGHGPAETADNDSSLIRFYSQALDRPAFQDEIRQEGSLEDFDKAMSDTIIAINTGCLRSSCTLGQIANN